MRLLWERHLEEGYTKEDYRACISHFLGEEESINYISNYVDGTSDLAEALSELLATVGIVMKEVPAKQKFEQLYGCRWVKQGDMWVLGAIAPSSPAYQGLSVGDELVAVDALKVTSHPDDLLRILDRDLVELTIFRKNQLMSISLSKDTQSFFNRYVLEVVETPNDGEIAKRSTWIESQ